MSAFIHSIATVVPPFVSTQLQIADFMIRNLGLNKEEQHRLRLLYRASGINQRYSVLEDFSKNLNGKSFFKEGDFPSAKPRMQLYEEKALGLALGASQQALNDAETDPSKITHLITVSCTGMYAPGLDIELIQKLNLATTTRRTSINFMGCYASFNALKVAADIIESDPQAIVLVVSVELCSIHLQDAKDDDNLLSNALFGDGAASVIIKGYSKAGSLELLKFHSDLALQGKTDMGWFIGDNGFEMKISVKVPTIIEEGIGELTKRLLEQNKLDLQAIDYYAIHPGGKKILQVIEQELGISKEQNSCAHDILRNFGNMSSPTVLFILQKILKGLTQEDENKHILSFAFGPGLTLESALLKIHF